MSKQKKRLSVLGVRKFTVKVPFRSRFGNTLTRRLFGWIHKTDIKDTQTGLRGIERQLVPHLVELKPNGYQFELEALTYLVSATNLIQTPITTVYEPGNPSSHFKPVLDSVKIYAVLLRHTVASLLITLLFFFLYYAFMAFNMETLIALILSRSIAIIVLFFISRELVFKSVSNIRRQAVHYLLLVMANILVLWQFVEIMSKITIMSNFTSMVVGQVILFFINFFIQQYIIFKK